MLMIENTIRNALIEYQIYIQIQNKRYNEERIRAIKKKINACIEYLDQGHKANGLWLENNKVIFDAVECAHKNLHQSYTEIDREYSSEEHKVLHKCMEFYKAKGIGSEYIDL